MTDMFKAAPFRPANLGSAVLESLSDRLRHAAGRGNIQAVKDLLETGAGLEPDKDGRTALHYAAQEGHAEVCKYLASHGCDVNIQDTMGYTPLLKAAAHGARETVQVLLDSGCHINMQEEHGNAAIHETCWNGFSQTAELLVRYNCDVFLTNKAGFTALHLAAQNGHNECSRVLLYAGCDADIRNNYGDTALHTAARYGHAGVARILISARCKLSEQNKNGDTALHIAAALKRRKIAKILVESGVDIELFNKQNEKAVDVARRKEHPEIMLIITSYSVPRAATAHQPEGPTSAVTFQETLNSNDEIQVHPENDLHQQSDAKVDKQGKERRFFFFKKKKKDKEKTSPITTASNQKKTKNEQVHPKETKPAVHGFFSQYVPREGVQLYRDLAGNIKQGPIGYAPVCQCGPSLRRLEHSITDTRESLYNHIDASHHILSKRIDNLDIQTKQQAHATDMMIQDRFSNEREACNARISQHLQEERQETQAIIDQTNTGMKEELEYWLNDKLASYGHCLDHHHDDSALPPRNLFFDFPTMGQLVRSRSDETLSASDYSGKFRKKDFYASRQAAMQQIRGWDIPKAESFSNRDRSRRRERNNNVIPNKISTVAQIHFGGSEKTRNSESRNDNPHLKIDSITSPTALASSQNSVMKHPLASSQNAGTKHPLTSSQNAGMKLPTGQTITNIDKFGTMGRSGNLPWQQTTHEIPQREHLNRVAFQLPVSFSYDKQQIQMPLRQRAQQPDSQPQGKMNPGTILKQNLKSPTRITSPGPLKRNTQHQAAPTSHHSRLSQQNLHKGGQSQIENLQIQK